MSRASNFSIVDLLVFRDEVSRDAVQVSASQACVLPPKEIQVYTCYSPPCFRECSVLDAGIPLTVASETTTCHRFILALDFWHFVSGRT
jgi:hypothetical protein